MITNDYVLVRLQYDLEFSEETMRSEIRSLCGLFGFLYEGYSLEGISDKVFFNIWFRDDPLFSSTYADIVKTFALQQGLLFLGAERCPFPKHLDEPL